MMKLLNVFLAVHLRTKVYQYIRVLYFSTEMFPVIRRMQVAQEAP